MAGTYSLRQRMITGRICRIDQGPSLQLVGSASAGYGPERNCMVNFTDNKGDKGMSTHIEYDDFGEYTEELEEIEPSEGLLFG